MKEQLRFFIKNTFLICGLFQKRDVVSSSYMLQYVLRLRSALLKLPTGNSISYVDLRTYRQTPIVIARSRAYPVLQASKQCFSFRLNTMRSTGYLWYSFSTSINKLQHRLQQRKLQTKFCPGGGVGGTYPSLGMTHHPKLTSQGGGTCPKIWKGPTPAETT